MTAGIPELSRMTVGDYDTGEVKEVFSNPNQIEEALSVLWSKKQPVGRSSARLHYGGTDNRSYSLSLYMDADKVAPPQGFTSLVRESLEGNAASGSGLGGSAAIMDWRRFLMHFCYPVQREDGVLQEPPDAIFDWPGFMAFRAKIGNVSFRYTRWVAGGEIDIYTANLSLISVGDVVVTSQEARTDGAEFIEFVFG